MAHRQATHAGSWYSSSGTELSKQLGGWLSKVANGNTPAKAIIAPHAGYAYCGACAAYAYKQIDPRGIKRIFILGPSHHYYLTKCAISMTSQCNTPLYPLQVDTEINNQLLKTGKFDKMSKSVDEDEHSIEMHLPYIAQVMSSRSPDSFTIVPILVGALGYREELMYGEIFSQYLVDPENLFVISSDFCHWGKRFRFTYYEKSHKHIFSSIEALDRKGMDLIEQLDPAGFREYLDKYQNTICGRHPIGVLLQAIDAVRKKQRSNMKMRFLNYAQSSQCLSANDSSVSYAAGVFNLSTS
ncbi:uncharacterized protein TRIADDRAFT_37128 [Trichoplax adhaerens]|uniref:Protein MEMO1 n=1 Tax=Trichoplax adhaerens TaxID=10228 RepID=B3RKM6_TRIAD|nr:hypothetical protein TRIADDRAFT_37128 [Trichoplax adhaerens]EDV29191.1 hypothetical protein TRIADDRAFT_37128 [Trichoplax adhaerens]|eukprot:XP_002108393.1 hypothetical protein TRIADDRAFT_37128 [Trichoplax adhaerens]